MIEKLLQIFHSFETSEQASTPGAPQKDKRTPARSANNRSLASTALACG
jgi:hypothetical protein